MSRDRSEDSRPAPASTGAGAASPNVAAELGALRERFEVGRADQRSLAVVRSVTAVLSGACAALLLLSDVPIPVFMAALLGVLMSLVWWAQGRKASRMAAAPADHSLAIHQHGFVICDGPQVRSVRFADVSGFEVDEERLEIVAILGADALPEAASGAAHGKLRIEPRYPGLAIHELVRRLQSAADADSHHVREGEPDPKRHPGSGR